MADLTYTEKLTFEKVLEMSSGYVLNFSDRTFAEFIGDAIGVDVNQDKYLINGTSKAKKLRAFWSIESNYVVADLLSKLLEYWRVNKLRFDKEISSAEQLLYEDCCKTVIRLREQKIVGDIDEIKPDDESKDFRVLAKLIHDSINENKPDEALDRLHTYVVKFIRRLCDKHNIKYSKEEALHSLFGKYVKHLVSNDLIESEMSERILKFSISLLDSFNDVRNNKSLAHDNPTLNYNESLLIFSNITSAIKFINAIESELLSKTDSNDSHDIEELPF